MADDMLVCMFKHRGMTQIEYDFIRAYVSAMRRDYHLLRSVLTMMNPDDLAIKSVTAATNLAIRAADLHNDFERRLGDVVSASKNNYYLKTVSDDPPVSVLADLFSLSFFTVAVKTDGDGNKANGLFSGEPSALAEMLQHLQQSNDTLKNSDAASQFLILLNMFGAPSGDNALFEFWNTVADMFKNGAGLANYGNFGQVYEDGYDDHDAEEEYEDDEDQDYEDDEYAD